MWYQTCQWHFIVLNAWPLSSQASFLKFKCRFGPSLFLPVFAPCIRGLSLCLPVLRYLQPDLSLAEPTFSNIITIGIYSVEALREISILCDTSLSHTAPPHPDTFYGPWGSSFCPCICQVTGFWYALSWSNFLATFLIILIRGIKEGKSWAVWEKWVSTFPHEVMTWF